MKELIELIGLVTSELPSKREFFNSVHGQKDQATIKLYKGIKSGRFKTDAEAAWELYRLEPTNKKYMMLRLRLMRRLSNSMFHFDQSQSKLSGYHKAVFRCNKRYFICRLLLTYGARSTATKMFRALIRDAEKFRIYEIVMLSCRYMANHYSLTGNKALFRFYYQKYDRAKAEFETEILSVRYFDEIQMAFAGNVLPKIIIVNRTVQMLAELKPLIIEYHSFNLHFNFARLSIISNLLKRNYTEAIAICKRTLLYLESNPAFYQRLGVAELNRILLECYIHERNFKKAEESAVISKGFIVSGSNNWFRFMETYFLIKMLSKNYRKALQIFNEVTSHPRFDKQAGARTEIWGIYYSYLNILYEADMLDELSPLKKFNLHKFINSVPNFSKDMFGFNLTILIAQFSLIIIRGQMESAIHKLDAFRNYRYRYLKTSNNYNYQRSIRFLNKLFLLCRYAYDKDKVRKIISTKKELKLLTDDTASAQIEMVEIIPYEVLMGILSKKIVNLGTSNI